MRILETSHPPTFFLPRTVFGRFLRPARCTVVCEWKCVARYVDVIVAGVVPLRDVGWWYPAPDARYPPLCDRVAGYAARSTRSPSTASGWWRSPAGSTSDG